ncbi:LOW QUALITY PROTEIN: solute carrier family 22 member 14 [Orycteropus afer afer]|uniref:LOW QUALITY PROTEIN: solute carrier family 22 member 14 n=1 Tax=Orycteropus afer afer TaxID=1230840 RepID=A0A8B7A7K6_ORYAF|nr:LOW QUALITY PROTEIN: solute carrier family 22 member 14 [Orycteropus afer afer]
MAREDNSKVEQLKSHYSSRILNPHSFCLEMLLQRPKGIRSDEDEDDTFASILNAVGEFGTFQRRLVALTFIPNILLSFFMFADSFVFTAQKAYCNTSWILAMDSNLSEAEQLNLTIPQDSNGSFLTCLMYSPVDWDLESIIKLGLNHTEMCQNEWLYPESERRSLTDEFDLVCGKELNWELIVAVYMAGLLIGSIIFGFIGDKLGRYPAILLSLLGLFIFGFGTAFVNSLQVYLLFRFVVSQAVAGYIISSMSLVTEWLVGEHRARAVILSHCYFSIGILFLLGLAYILPHWRLLFLLGGAPVLSVIPYIWILPESPRWLMVRGKVEEAKQVLRYAASVNKKVIPLDLLNKLELSGKKESKTCVLDSYSNMYLCKVTLIIGCMWFTVTYSYLTLSIKVKDFGMSHYARQMIPSLLEMPVRLFCILLVEHIGRKWTLALTLFQASLVCLCILLLPEGGNGPRLKWPVLAVTELKLTVTLVTLTGEFSLASSITLLLIYTAELLPTVLRSTGLGLVSLALVTGAILSLMTLLIKQNYSILSVCLSFCSAALALYLCCQLPEMQDQSLVDTIEHLSSQLRSS